MVNFGILTAEICCRVWDTSANFNGFPVFAALLHGTLVVGVSQICGVEQRAPPIFGMAAITLGIGPHSSLINYCINLLAVIGLLNDGAVETTLVFITKRAQFRSVRSHDSFNHYST